MAAFAIFDPVSGVDVSEHATLADAYRAVDKLNHEQGGTRFAVRIGAEHRVRLEDQERDRKRTGGSFLS